MNEQDLLQERLERLEAGDALEACLIDLPEAEVDMLRLAVLLQQMPVPARDAKVVHIQRAALLQLAAEKPAAPTRPAWQRSVDSVRTALRAWLQQRTTLDWIAIGGLAPALIVLIVGLVVSLFSAAEPQMIQVPDSGSTVLSGVHGVAQVQTSEGTWTAVGDSHTLQAGQRIRTGALSQATLHFYDGSQVEIGPDAELWVDELDVPRDGTPRVIRLTVWDGETVHDVIPSEHEDSRYEVRTPSATSVARGTTFTVAVHLPLLTRVSVAEGMVDVSAQSATQTVVAGQTSTVPANQPPSPPNFTVTGEGPVTQMGDTWLIAGQAFAIHADTIIIGNPQLNDIVSVEGRLLTDGSLVADVIRRLGPAPIDSFHLTGEVEVINDTTWVIAGQSIAIDANTQIEAGIAAGDVVSVDGAIQPDGTLLAMQITLVASGDPFHFAGVVQSIEGNIWTISGIMVTVNDDTVIDPEIEVGDEVAVNGRIQGDTWLAHSIQRVPADDAAFDMTGTVESIDPWVVSGISFETRSWTVIDAGIDVGDRVRVRGPILADGTWVAAVVERIAPPADDVVTITFIGSLSSMNPWAVNGLTLVVDEATVIEDGIQVGDLVRVTATQLADGAWHADVIERVEMSGCVIVVSVVIDINVPTITLQDGTVINLNEVPTVEGEIVVGSTIRVTICTSASGTVVIVVIVVVVTPPMPTPPTVMPAPTVTSLPAVTPSPTVTPVSSVTIGCYRVTFLGVTYNADGSSTWRYRVDELACAQDLSNWVLALPACAVPAAAAPSPWEIVNPDPNHGLSGIKWEVGAGFSSGEFSVTVAGHWAVGTTQVGVKGPDVALGTIAGPVCELPTPTATATGTVTATLTPTATLTATATILPTVTPSPTLPPPSPTAPPPPPPPAPPPGGGGAFDITDNNQTLTLTCNGHSVTVRGNANTITLLGSCGSIVVRGNSNTIFYQAAASITNTGNNNIIQQR